MIMDDNVLKWAAVSLYEKLKKLKCPSCGQAPPEHDGKCDLVPELLAIYGWQTMYPEERAAAILNEPPDYD